MKKYVLIGAATLLSIFGLLLLFSPFEYDKQTDNYVLSHEVIIDKSVQEVFDYVGQSKNASKWSVFVNHITPLNTDTYRDGTVGSQRRCFKNKNEKGVFWDETILNVIPLKERSLSIYNLNGFAVTTENLVTYQHYEIVGEQLTKLRFSLVKARREMGMLERTKIILAAYVVSSIFEKNLKGIKKQLEQQHGN